MYTQCPECESSFRVTAEVLKQAAGMVRCGSCGNAFNSLDYLSEQKPDVPEPGPSIPELKPEPRDKPVESGVAAPPKSISAEQSAALLKTLDQLAGEDIRIEDTGVEWRVLGADDDEPDETDSTFDPSQTDVSHLDSETEIDFSDSSDESDPDIENDGTGIWIVGESRNVDSDEGPSLPDSLETRVDETDVFATQATAIDELLDEAPTPVDELLEPGANEIENAELFETQMMGAAPSEENADLFKTQAMGTTSADADTDSSRPQIPDPVASTDNEGGADAVWIDAAQPQAGGAFAGATDEMRFDDDTPLPDDFLQESAASFNAPTGMQEPAQEQQSAPRPDPQSQLALSEPDDWEQLLDEFDDLLTTDLDTSAQVNGSAADTDNGTIEDDLLSAAFENEEQEPPVAVDEDTSIDDDLMSAAFDIEEREQAEAREDEGAAAETQNASLDDDEPGDDEMGSDDAEVDTATAFSGEASEKRLDNISDHDDQSQTDTVVAGAEELSDDGVVETGSELGDVLNEASRLAESLDDESGHFQLDDEDQPETDPGDESGAEEQQARELDGDDIDAERRNADDFGDQSIAEEILELEASGQFSGGQLGQAEDSAANEDLDEESADATLRAAGDDGEEPESALVDDESVEESEGATVSSQADDEDGKVEEKLDLESVLDPDDEGLVDSGEHDSEASEDDLPELHDVGDHPDSKHDIPPMTEEEETINMLIDQDLLAMAQVDDDGFASTIVVEEGLAPVKVESVVIGEADNDEDKGTAETLETAAQSEHQRSGVFRLTGQYSTNPDDEPGRRRTIGIAAALLALAVALGGQFIHQNRESLATNPAFGDILNPVYEKLGKPITPDWDVSGWDIARTQGATDEQDQLLTIFSEIRNTSDAALPYPVVTLALTDRYQDSIGALILEPADYLPNENNATGLVPPGGKFEAVIPIDEPSPEAIGYTINACYRTPGGDLRCAISDFK